MSTLHDIVDPWLRDDDSDDLIQLRDQLVWLKRHLFNEYEPSSYQTFDDRLTKWLENVPDGADRRALFKLLGHLFFVAKPQFKALCLGAFNDAIARWLLDQEGIGLTDADMSTRLEAAAARTWFCPVTDSMNINSFLKVNNLSGHDIRTDWRSLEALADPAAVHQHIIDKNIRRIVFLEDFVGSGGQMRSTVVWARHALADIPILLAPLICCPEGVITGNLLAKRFNLTFAPTLSLRDDLFLLADPSDGEPQVFGEIRNLVERCKSRLGGWVDEPFGHEGTGAIIAMFSNCPDNTLPIIHEQNSNWRALFPRVGRE